MIRGCEQVTQLLVAVAVLLIAARCVGHLFVCLRQPRVVGEIVGGLFLGPTFLSSLAPSVKNRMFPETGLVSVVLYALAQFGLISSCTTPEARFSPYSFEKRAGTLTTSYGAKSQMIFDAIDRFSGNFSVSDIQKICPGVSLDLIRRRLKELKAAGRVEPSGRGPSAVWRKTP